MLLHFTVKWQLNMSRNTEQQSKRATTATKFIDREWRRETPVEQILREIDFALYANILSNSCKKERKRNYGEFVPLLLLNVVNEMMCIFYDV